MTRAPFSGMTGQQPWAEAPDLAGMVGAFNPPEWTRRAACMTTLTPDAWFPPGKVDDGILDACATCPVAEQCFHWEDTWLNDSTTVQKAEGVWAGMKPAWWRQARRIPDAAQRLKLWREHYGALRARILKDRLRNANQTALREWPWCCVACGAPFRVTKRRAPNTPAYVRRTGRADTMLCVYCQRTANHKQTATKHTLKPRRVL